MKILNKWNQKYDGATTDQVSCDQTLFAGYNSAHTFKTHSLKLHVDGHWFNIDSNVCISSCMVKNKQKSNCLIHCRVGYFKVPFPVTCPFIITGLCAF